MKYKVFKGSVNKSIMYRYIIDLFTHYKYDVTPLYCNNNLLQMQNADIL